MASIRKRSKVQSLSSLSQAYELTKRASRLGFDWPDIGGVLEKMDEEIGELREALSLQDRKKIREELGDLLFVMVNIARFLRINPEEALGKSVEKFRLRFHYMASWIVTLLPFLLVLLCIQYLLLQLILSLERCLEYPIAFRMLLGILLLDYLHDLVRRHKDD